MEQLIRTISQVGNAVRRHRRALNLTQGQVCERSNLRQATLSNLESGGSGARLATLLDVLTVLDLEMVIRERKKAPKIEDIF